jgi:hypothetical protein
MVLPSLALADMVPPDRANAVPAWAVGVFAVAATIGAFLLGLRGMGSSKSRPASRSRYALHGMVIGLLCSVLGSAALLSSAGCKLTPAQATAANAILKPICDGTGPALAPVPYIGPFGGLIALVCDEVEAQIVADETVVPVDAGVTDGGVKAALVHAQLVAAPGCAAVPIPGDPRHQVACPELHEQILAAGRKVDARKAVRR